MSGVNLVLNNLSFRCFRHRALETEFLYAGLHFQIMGSEVPMGRMCWLGWERERERAPTVHSHPLHVGFEKHCKLLYVLTAACGQWLSHILYIYTERKRHWKHLTLWMETHTYAVYFSAHSVLTKTSYSNTMLLLSTPLLLCTLQQFPNLFEPH